MAEDEHFGAVAPLSELRALAQRVERLESELSSLQAKVQEQSPTLVSKATVAPPPPLPVRGPLEWSHPQAIHPTAVATSPPLFATSAASPKESLESRLGSQYFNRIAIVLLLIGTAYGLKLAVDRGLIGPVARVVIGLVSGAGLVLWSERFRRKGFVAFSYSLKALGSGVLYLSLWAGFRLYHLLPSGVALGLMLLVTTWNAYMAWAQDSELLAAYALAGGFVTPMLLSNGGNHEIFLFCYLLAMDVAGVVLVRLRPWPRLLLGVFPLTVAYFIGWYTQFYAAEALGVTSAFIALFAATFASVPLWNRADRGDRLKTLLEDILLPLGNAAFVGLAFYSVLQDANRHESLPWMVLALAAIYLGLVRLPQAAVASAIHLSVAVVFLTIAIPLKASGAWITVSWLVEGAALLWVAARLGEEAATAYATRTLRWLGVGSLGLGFCGVLVNLLDTVGDDGLAFWNKGTATALTAVAAFAIAGWLALRHQFEAEAWGGVARTAYWLTGGTAVLLAVGELIFSWEMETTHRAFATASFGMALAGLAVFAGMIAFAMRTAATRAGESFWITCAAVSSVAFNLIAVLTGVREMSALFAPPAHAWSADAALQQSLAISGFLMLYGAALLAVGFWRRNGFLRWQALALLLFTICKAFLYDMRNLSQGYRVASLLTLGALLLAVSFAYQKDWLNLRGEDKHSEVPR